MSRVNRMQSTNSNPAEKFFQWKSDHQKFAYYDKAKEENIFVELPLKFLGIVAYKTVKGFNPKRGKKGAGIFANEVKTIGQKSNETLKVQFFDEDKSVIAEGKWNDIKETVDNAGGKFTESVYAMLEDGTLVNFQINGAALSTWYEFQKNQSDKFFDNWIVVKGFKEATQGKVNYTYPVFEWGSTLNRSEQKLAEACDKKISDYESWYFDGKEVAPDAFADRAQSEVDKYDVKDAEEVEAGSDDLDF
jgi:hypothetical protein